LRKIREEEEELKRLEEEERKLIEEDRHKIDAKKTSKTTKESRRRG